MADWTLTASHCFQPRKSHGACNILHFQESTCASTATVIRGQVITADTVVSTSGLRLVRAPSSGGTGANLLQVAITSLLGVAAETSTRDGSTTGLGTDLDKCKLPVYSADNIEFKGWLKGNGPSGSSMVGSERAIIFDSTLKMHFIDSTNSTAALMAVLVTGVPVEAMGDTNGPVYFKFLSSLVNRSVVF